MKKLVIALIVVAALGGGIFAWHSYKSPSGEENAPATVSVTRGPIRSSISSTGKVVSNLDVEIKCKASGEIIKLPFDISDTIKRGDLLLELDPTDEQRGVDQAKVSLSSSKARLVIAQENLTIAEDNLSTDRQKADATLKSARVRADDTRAKADRIKNLLAGDLASQEEYETSETLAFQSSVELELARVRLEELKTQERALELSRQQVQVAKAQVESDTIALDLARQRLADTKVTAPMDGVITSRSVQIGQIISSGISNVGGGTTTMTLSDLSRLFVLASVDESNIGTITLGQTVEITVDAFPRKRFEGSVVRIATTGVNVSNVVTFEVKIEVSSPEKALLKPEMTANVEIIAAEKDNALLAPANAIVRREGKLYATVVQKGRSPQERDIATGITDGTTTEILSGLDEGDTILMRDNGINSRWVGDDRPRSPVPRGMISGRR